MESADPAADLTSAQPTSGAVAWFVADGRVWPWLILIVFVVRVMLSLLIVPPWQQPDEPAHMVYAEVVRVQLGLQGHADFRQHAVLQSMKAHDWWRHYGVETPAVVPQRFIELTPAQAQESIGISPAGNEALPAYHAIAGVLLAAARLEDVDAALLLLRGLSAGISVATLWVAWRGARAALGADGGDAVAALLAVHPQFLHVATTGGPDATVNFAGAAFWWAAVTAIRGSSPLRCLALVWAVALLAAAIDRVGIPLIMAAALATVVVLAPSRWRVAACAAAVALVSVGLAIVIWSPWGASGLGVAVGARARTWGFFWDFVGLVFQSWWLAVGWLRYRTPEWWWLATVLVSCVALFGLVRHLSRAAHDDNRVVLGLGLLLISVQTAAIYWAFYRVDVAAQGRYLFPFLVPTLVLVLVGVRAAVPVRYAAWAAPALVATVAMLDAASWVFVTVPAYVR